MEELNDNLFSEYINGKLITFNEFLHIYDKIKDKQSGLTFKTIHYFFFVVYKIEASKGILLYTNTRDIFKSPMRNY